MTEYIISRTDLSAIQRTKIDLYGGVELVRCKDCRYYDHGENESESWSICIAHINRYFQTCAENYCAWAERKDEYVTLHHEDIHFIDEDAERAFYESLAERKEE